MSFREFLEESKEPRLPSDINKNYLKGGTIVYKNINVIDADEQFSVNLWLGEIPRNKGFGIVFSSFDAGIESKTKTFADIEQAQIFFDKFVNNMNWFDAVKLMRK